VKVGQADVQKLDNDRSKTFKCIWILTEIERHNHLHVLLKKKKESLFFSRGNSSKRGEIQIRHEEILHSEAVRSWHCCPELWVPLYCSAKGYT